MPHALVADADLVFLSQLEGLLNDEGLEVVKARDGAEAVRLLAQSLPAILLCELSLPKKDGYEVLAELRRRATPQQVPAIAISSFGKLRGEALERKTELGLAAVIGKTHAASFLKRTIRRALGKPEDQPEPKTAPRSPFTPIELREVTRLRRIAELGILEGPDRDVGLHKLVDDALRLFNVPSAAVSIVDDAHQRMIAQVGFGPGSQFVGTREDSFCRHLVEADGPGVLVVPDAALHPYFRSNKLVRDGLLRSYAGAPLLSSTGEVLGSLCIADNKPLSISAEQVEALVTLARRVSGELELRAALMSNAVDADLPDAEIVGEDDPLESMRLVLERLEQPVFLLDADRRVIIANDGVAEVFQQPQDQLIGLTREALLGLGATLTDDPAQYARGLRVEPAGPYSFRVDVAFTVPRRRVLRIVSRPVPLPTGPVQLTSFTDITAEVTLHELRGE